MKKFSSILIVIAIALTVLLVFVADKSNLVGSEKTEERISSVDKNPKTDSHHKMTQNQSEKRPQNSQLTHSHLEEKEPHFKNRANDTSWWFTTPSLESDTQFSQTHTTVELDVSCHASHSLEASISLEENFEKIAQASTQTRYQEDLFYFTLTQFWRLDQDFYQFVAIWDRDMPAVYRYEFYRSQDKSFNENVEPLDLPIAIPKYKDVLATNQYVAQLTAYYQQRGAELGSRILESTINDPRGDQQISLVNSQVVKWQTADFSCDSDTQFNKAYCYCNQGEQS